MAVDMGGLNMCARSASCPEADHSASIELSRDSVTCAVNHACQDGLEGVVLKEVTGGTTKASHTPGAEAFFQKEEPGIGNLRFYTGGRWPAAEPAALVQSEFSLPRVFPFAKKASSSSALPCWHGYVGINEKYLEIGPEPEYTENKENNVTYSYESNYKINDFQELSNLYDTQNHTQNNSTFSHEIDGNTYIYIEIILMVRNTFGNQEHLFLHVGKTSI